MNSRVLIVEDDPDFAETLAIALEILDFGVVRFRSAEEAEAHAGVSGLTDVRLGFFDVKLAKEDGITCMRKLLNSSPGLNGVIMTGFRDERLMQQARDAGAVDVLLKPFRMSAFIALVREYA